MQRRFREVPKNAQASPKNAQASPFTIPLERSGKLLRGRRYEAKLLQGNDMKPSFFKAGSDGKCRMCDDVLDEVFWRRSWRRSAWSCRGARTTPCPASPLFPPPNRRHTSMFLAIFAQREEAFNDAPSLPVCPKRPALHARALSHPASSIEYII